MRFILLGIFVFFFVAIPMYLLNAVVMSDLQSLHQSYGTAGTAAEAVAPVSSAEK